MNFLTLFPLFLAIGFRLSVLISLIFEVDLSSVILSYYFLMLFFYLANLISLNDITETFFNRSINPYKTFFLTVISFGLYIPYFLLSYFEKTGIFDKKMIFLSFFLPYIAFFLWVRKVYISLLKIRDQNP